MTADLSQTRLNEEDRVSDLIAVIVRFRGDPDDLAGRFERARQMWIDAQDADYSWPLFYAACKQREHPRGGSRARQTETGLVVVTVWESQAAHMAFNHRMRPHLAAVGMGMPDRFDHRGIDELGWD
ncbi:MAG: hypothetical protein ACRD07_15570 [Acidimicrobiales bacterium]